MATLGQFSNSKITVGTTPVQPQVTPLKTVPIPTPAPQSTPLKPPTQWDAIKTGLGVVKNWFGQSLLGKAINYATNVPIWAGAGALRKADITPMPSTYAGRWDVIKSGAKEGIQKQTTFGEGQNQYNIAGGFKNPLLRSTANFLENMGMPTLFDLGLIKGASKLLGKGSELVKPALKPAVESLTQFAKETPAIYKPIETFSPYFRNPGVGKILTETKGLSREAQATMAQAVMRDFKNLSGSEQILTQQLIRGNVSTPEVIARSLMSINKDLSEVEAWKKADQIIDTSKRYRFLLDELGKAEVQKYAETGGRYGMSPETYQERVGKYFPKVKEEFIGKGNLNAPSDIAPSLETGFLKHRKTGEGMEGFVQQAGAPLFKRLAAGASNLEIAKGYQEIANKYGVDMQKVTSLTDVTKEAINSLLKDFKAPRSGLGPLKAGLGEARTNLPALDNIANQLLDAFKQYQPAHRLTKAEEKAEKIYTGLAHAELTGKTPQAIEIWVRKNGAAFQQMFGWTPDESALRAVIDKVGELPSPERVAHYLTTQKSFRPVLEGMGYAGGEITKKGVAKIFTDVALSPETIEIINKSVSWKPMEWYEKAMMVLNSAWKMGKTITNPAYFFRNSGSNQILADMGHGHGLLESMARNVQGGIEFVGHKFAGSEYGDITKLAEKVDLFHFDGYLETAQKLLDDAEGVERGFFQKIPDTLRGIQNFQEDTAKLGVFKIVIEDEAIKRGISISQALVDKEVIAAAKTLAQKSIFTPYKIGSGERGLFRFLVPFYSFTRQMIPHAVETLVKYPERFAKYPKIKVAVEALSGDKLVPEAQRPDWQKGDIQLPPFINRFLGEKNPVSWGAKYILPWGNVVDENASVFRPFGLSLNPVIEEAFAQRSGIDPYFNKPFVKSSLPGVGPDMFSLKPRLSGSQRAAHALTTFAPALYRTVQGKLLPAFQGVPDYAGRDRSKIMAVLDAAGLKMSVLRPEDQVKFRRWDKNAKLKQIRSERYAITKDKTLTPEERRYWLKQYDDLRVSVIREE